MTGYDYWFGILAGYMTGGQRNPREVGSYENDSKKPATDIGGKNSCF